MVFKTKKVSILSSERFITFFSSRQLEEKLKSKFSGVYVTPWGRLTNLGFRFRRFSFALDQDYRVTVVESLFISYENRGTEPILNVDQNIKICLNDRICSKGIEILVSFNPESSSLTVQSASENRIETLLKFWRLYVLPSF